MADDEFIPAPPLPHQRRLALVVTTSTYGSPEYPDLPAASHDATTMTALLAEPEACGFEVTTLADVPATEIRRAINEILDDRDRSDLVLVYLSCHGVRDRKGRLYLVTTDTDPTLLPATAVAARYLMDLSEDSRAGQQIIILDCCYSGAFDAKGVGLAELVAPDKQADDTTASGRCILTASRAAEYSFQYRLAGGDIAGSVFTSALVEGVRTGRADIANNGRITVQDAYRYAYAAVKEYNQHQTPQFDLRGAEGSAIVLARNPVGIRTGESDLYELVAALDSPHPAFRTAAVQTLGELLHDANPAKSAAARRNLAKVTGMGDNLLAPLAQQLLAGGEPAGPARTHDDRPVPPAPRRSRPMPRRRPAPTRPSMTEPTGPGPAPQASRAEGDGSPDPADIEPLPLLDDEELSGLRAVEDPLGVFPTRRVRPLEEVVSPAVARHLFPTERFRGQWRRHWLPPMAAAALSGWVSGRALLPVDPEPLRLPPELLDVPTSEVVTWSLVTVAVLAAWHAIAWPYWRLVLTNKRIMIVRGILWQRTWEVPLLRVTNTRSTSSPLGRLLGYGTLSFDTGRWRSHRVRYLPSLNITKLRIDEQIFEPEAVEARLAAYDDEPYDGEGS